MAASKNEWTAGRIKSFITSVLRAGSRRWPPKYETLNKCLYRTKDKQEDRTTCKALQMQEM